MGTETGNRTAGMIKMEMIKERLQINFYHRDFFLIFSADAISALTKIVTLNLGSFKSL